MLVKALHFYTVLKTTKRYFKNTRNDYFNTKKCLYKFCLPVLHHVLAMPMEA